MSPAKPAILLAGGQPRSPAALTAALSQALAAVGQAKPRVAYIGTANQDSMPFFTMIKALLQGAGAGQVDLVKLARRGASVAEAQSILSAADVIFLSGGEVEDGIAGLAKAGLVPMLHDLFSQGRLFIGVSAGSIMMGSHWVRWAKPDDDVTAELFPCLGLVPAVFDTHAEDEDWHELKTALRLLGPGSQGYGIPSGGVISASGQGELTNQIGRLLVFANIGGQVQRIE
jgi:peptidase E